MLTDEHISMLERCSAKYVNANTEGWKKIVRNAADTIEKNWQEDTVFNKDTVTSVCDLSAKLGHSQKKF